MGIKRIIRIVLGCAALLLLWLYLPRAAKDVHAQFAGYFAEQTITYSFTVTGNNPSPTTYALPNIGQAGHSLMLYSFSQTVGVCPVWLEGSADNSHWQVLVSTGSIANAGGTGTVFAQGYYLYLRIIVNPNNSTCEGGFAGQYTGYQFPPSEGNARLNSQVSVSTPTAIDNFSGEIFPNLQRLTAINCYNPGTSVAFLQIFDSLSPTLGSLIQFQTAIAAGQTVQYPVDVLSAAKLQAGASTTWSGTTAVTTALNCNFEFNPYGPFY